ncbi:hypothetical protein H1C71_034873, partial [Ictidomys tridecemlineatus]
VRWKARTTSRGVRAARWHAGARKSLDVCVRVARGRPLPAARARAGRLGCWGRRPTFQTWRRRAPAWGLATPARSSGAPPATLARAWAPRAEGLSPKRSRAT